MELRHLRYFVTIAQELSFTRAAAKLRVAQPALTRQIRQLEDELGVKLLERDQRGTHLTGAGRTFLTEACAVLEQSERAIQAARQSAQMDGARLNVGYVWSLFHSVVPELIGRFRQLLPDVAVNLFDHTGLEQGQGLLEGRLDAGFIGFDHEAAVTGLARRKVGSCAFMAALPKGHSYARKAVIPLRQLSRESFIMVSEQTYPGASRVAYRACQSAGFQPKVAQTVERGFTILGLVASKGGIALLPASLRSLPHPGVVFRPLSEPPEADLYVAWKATRPQTVRDTFLSLL